MDGEDIMTTRGTSQHHSVRGLWVIMTAMMIIVPCLISPVVTYADQPSSSVVMTIEDRTPSPSEGPDATRRASSDDDHVTIAPLPPKTVSTVNSVSSYWPTIVISVTIMLILIVIGAAEHYTSKVSLSHHESESDSH
jgi:hypothetical protein